MEKDIIQTVVQEPKNAIPKRAVVIYKEEEEDKTSVIDYDSLTIEEKELFDNFNTMIQSKL
jgi:hypothetical protein